MVQKPKKETTVLAYQIEGSHFYKDFVESLLPYLYAGQFRGRKLLALKVKEATFDSAEGKPRA